MELTTEQRANQNAMFNLAADLRGKTPREIYNALVDNDLVKHPDDPAESIGHWQEKYGDLGCSCIDIIYEEWNEAAEKAGEDIYDYLLDSVEW